MSSPISSVSRSVPEVSTYLLYALIAALAFTDFLQTGVAAFNAAPVMGDIGASPEEYSLVATLYAVVAIAVLLIHRALVERLGWRAMLQGSAALLAAGSLVCASSDSLVSFAAGRIVMALGCASFLTAGRVLVNRIPSSPRRFTGVKFFASGLAWGAVAGPTLAALCLASRDWRASFVALLVPAAIVASLAGTLDDESRPRAPEPVPSQPTVLLVGLASAFVLLHVLQRASFDFFTDGTMVVCAVLGAIAVLGLCVCIAREQAHPLLQLHRLGGRRYLVGIALFGLGYLLLGANNTMLPFLLQRAMGLPLEVIGVYLGLGALGGVASWIVLARLLPRHSKPAPYYLAGFGALSCCGWQLAHLSEAAHPLASVLPALLCNGAFIVIVLSTTALQTFRKVQHDDTVFSHANQVKNILAQFGIGAGISMATICMQWRSSARYSQLAEAIVPSSAAFQQTMADWTQYFAAHQDPATARGLALAQIAQTVGSEATFMAALDYFHLVWLTGALCAAAVAAVSVWGAARGRAIA